MPLPAKSVVKSVTVVWSEWMSNPRCCCMVRMDGPCVTGNSGASDYLWRMTRPNASRAIQRFVRRAVSRF
jgi:hypothetical protein